MSSSMWLPLRPFLIVFNVVTVVMGVCTVVFDRVRGIVERAWVSGANVTV